MKRRLRANLVTVLRAAAALSILASVTAVRAQTYQNRNAPGDAPSWQELLRPYSVLNNRDPMVTEETRKASQSLSTHIVMIGPRGEKVTGGFLRPKQDGLYPVVLLLHGPFSDKEAVLKSYGIPLVANGFAVLALDAPYYGERKNSEIDPLDTTNLGDSILEGVREYRRAIDWLISRKDIDSHRIGLIGFSLGAMMGTILGAVDDRVQDVVLCGGGDPIVSFASNVPVGKRDRMYTICPSLFIGHISPRRVLMLNARLDTVMLLPATLRLFDAAAEPKTIEWYDTDHQLPYSHVNRAVSWLSQQLNPAPIKLN